MVERDGAPGRPRRTTSTGLSRLRRPRLYEQLADHITAFIEAQGLSPGERLPPERLLAEQLGVSRATLAQALVALEVRGVVDVRHGEGAVLREATDASALEVSLAAHEPDARDLADARGAVLGALAALAAVRADADERRALAAALDDGSASRAPQAVTALLAGAAASPTLARLAHALEGAGRGDDPAEDLAAVVRAVLAGDPDGARRAASGDAAPVGAPGPPPGVRPPG